MKILKAIGGVFVKIWRWIKNTAWVQPLLIVGVIFGVIFSIPAISGGIQGLISGANSADTFYHSFQRSMEGEKNSDAEKLLENYNNYENAYIDNPEAWDPSIVPAKERKYFLMFTASNNAETKEIKAGFETLRADWNTPLFEPINKGEEFRLYTIFTDEKTSSTTPNETAFSKFLYNRYSFFEKASQVGLDSDYYLNKKITDDDLNNLATPSPDNFKIPTVILVDWTLKVTPDKNPGITEVMFDVPGDTPTTRAELLYDCWNCKNDFTSNPNN